MKVSVIIVTFNGLKWISKCLESLIKSTAPFEITVIDNGSTDRTNDVIRKNYPTVKLLGLTENLGFGKANNIGMKMALEENADYVLLLNQDAWVEPDTIEKLITIHKKNPHFGILAPLQLNGQGTLIDKLFLEYTVTPCRELVTDFLLQKSPAQVYETPFANAACWLLPLTTIKKIGGFDPLFPQYGEDDDYVNRMKFHGLKIGLCPAVRVYHDREYRPATNDLGKMTNLAYIRALVELKNNAMHCHSKMYYYKKIIFYRLNSIFGNNRTFYKSRYRGILQIIKNYPTVIEHRSNEIEQKQHYLFESVLNLQ